MNRKRFEIRAKLVDRFEAVRHGFMTGSTLAIVSSAICILGLQPVQADQASGHSAATSTAEPTLATPAASSARSQKRCSEAAIDVEAGSSEQRRRVCSAASRAVGRLDQCDIVLQRPLRIEIRDEVRHPGHGEAVFGFFDPTREVVLVVGHDRIPDLVVETPYGALRTLAFFSSVIVHEVVHGVMHQNLRRDPTSHAAYEYPAYAIQLELLPFSERQKLLRAKLARPMADNFIFSDAILFFDPFFFAARAYQHFQDSPNRCALLVALLEGSAPFIRPSLLY